jgi:hypothetical protein
MSTRRRASAALAAIAVAVLGSGCGSSAPTSTAGTTRASSSAHTTTATSLHRAVTFAKCMRSHGVSRFPDPGPSGKLTIDGIANGSSLDTSSPTFTQAITSCKSLEPAGFTGGKRSAPQTQAALAFARCIRDHGVKDFPDPANGQPLVDTNRIPSSATPSGMSILNAAMHACHDFGAAAIGSQQ